MMRADSGILVVDDDAETVSLLKLYLENDGHKVLCAYDGVQALRLAREERPRLVVLDLMLPGLDGLQVCRALRSESDVPVIMLTARTAENDKLAGLEIGADDYVTKPFSPRELAARAKAVLRRRPSESLQRGPAQVTHGDLKLDFPQRALTVAGQPVDLTPTEFRLPTLRPDGLWRRLQVPRTTTVIQMLLPGVPSQSNRGAEDVMA